MIKKEKKANKVQIHVKDEDTGIEWFVEVDEEEFEWCVVKKKELEVEDPVKSAMLDFAIFGNCSNQEDGKG